MGFKNKRILITAGPTWVPVDSVRVISNTATGSTGISLAESLSGLRAKVTLLLGPVGDCAFGGKISVIRFKFFDELRRIVRKKLSLNRYDIIIHSAAVSDFKPKRSIKGKLKSQKNHTLVLTPLPKIIKEMRRLAPLAKLVMFKLEPDAAGRTLISRARSALIEASGDLVVANKITPRYEAYILGRDKIYARANSKKELISRLIELLRQGYPSL